MGDTYSQIYIHIIFSTQNRKPWITDEYQEKLYAYIIGASKNRGHRVVSIGGIPDHIHILISMKPSESISNYVREIKRESTKFLQDKIHQQFKWQEGFSAFSCSRSQIQNVSDYIDNQKEHHRKRSFKEEYLEFLDKHDVSYKDEYVF